MSKQVARYPAWIALAGAVLGLVFAAYSTLDYVRHLDRQVHDLHCSIVPGAAAVEAAESGSRTALYSAYSALWRDKIWGGVPISLFAVGAFSFFAAVATYLGVASGQAPRRAWRFLGYASLGPVLVSITMAIISATELGSFCQTCIGIYVSSAILAIGGILGWVRDVRSQGAEGQPLGAKLLPVSMAAGLAIFVIIPTAFYLRRVPSYAERVRGCGELAKPMQGDAALRVTYPRAKESATMVVDPLCPSCKAFHQRLESEGVLEQLDVTVVLFPLDSECNWNLSTPLHAGACELAKAVLCGERPMDVLEWAYAEQEALTAAGGGKDGKDRLGTMIRARWGEEVGACVEKKETRMELDQHLRFAVENNLPVATPQLFVNRERLCDEDMDIGLSYALARIAPTVME